jgi:RNA polymerase sigma-70 factor, ECF subfamily
MLAAVRDDSARERATGRTERPGLDPAARSWLAALRSEGATRDEALARLHRLLLDAARFQLARRGSRLRLRGESLADLATAAADDALVAVVARLDDFRGESRFETWASKFAIFESSAVLRRRLWKEHEQPPADVEAFAAKSAVDDLDEQLEHHELLTLLREAVAEVLSERQRAVFVAVALNEVPIDLVAERFGTTRGAIYKLLHDARRKLRARLAAIADGAAVP